MKFRRLTNEELSGLQKEFIHFLIINGLDANAWEKIKDTDMQKADTLIDIFSDMVFEGVISKVKYLEHIGKEGLHLFKCEDDVIKLTGIIPPRAFDHIDEMIAHIQKDPADFRIFHTSKTYRPSKNAEIFTMIESGALVSEGYLYEQFQHQ